MRQILFFVSILVGILGISGCSDSPIDTVKDGVLKFNKTITVGEALDNWQNCKTRKWEAFKTNNGMQVVNFTCNLANIDEYIKSIKEGLSQNPKWKNLDNIKRLQLESDTITYQFTINKDNSFQLNSVQEKIKWKDGVTYTRDLKPLASMENAYNNYIKYKPMKLDSHSAYLKYRALGGAYTMGKIYH